MLSGSMNSPMSCASSSITKRAKSVSFTSEEAAPQHDLENIIADLRDQLKNKAFMVTQVSKHVAGIFVQMSVQSYTPVNSNNFIF
jgi:hypothetical protein